MNGINRERLFVYGTLRGAGEAASMLAGCDFLRMERLSGTLYDLGEYPALVIGGNATVRGELWSCPSETLRDLDSYEQVGAGLFERIRIHFPDGPAWTYVAGPLLTERLTGAVEVRNGDWLSAFSRSAEGEGEKG